MAVAFSPKGVVFGPTRGVVLNRILPPVIGGVSQALITGIPAYHDAALAVAVSPEPIHIEPAMRGSLCVAECL